MLTEVEKAKVIALHGQGLSYVKISNVIKCHKATVMRILNPATRRPASRRAGRPVGRPAKFNRTTDSFLLRVIDREPHLSASRIKKMYPEIFGRITVRSIQGRLKGKLNRPARRAAKKPMLTEKMRKKRLEFAMAYQHWTPSDWNKVHLINLYYKGFLKSYLSCIISYYNVIFFIHIYNC
jgi:transposase